MSTYGFDESQSLRKRHLDEYRGFERMGDGDLLAALDDPACSPDRCCLIATELVARGSDTSGVVPLLRWILRGFDGNQTRYRAAISLARMGEWDGEVQGALQHITERYPRTHGDARAAQELLQNHGKPVAAMSAGPAMNLPKAPAILARELPRIELPTARDRESDPELHTSTGEALPPLDLPSIPGEMPASRIKIRKSRKTLAYPSARNTAIIAIFVILVGILVAVIISQSSPQGSSLEVLVTPE